VSGAEENYIILGYKVVKIFYVIYPDGQTDRQASLCITPNAMHTRHAVKRLEAF